MSDRKTKGNGSNKNAKIRVNNAAVIQYQTKKGDMKVLAFSDYDEWQLKHRVSIHMCQKKVLSIQFYYDVSTNKEIQLIKKGVILE